MKKILIVSHCFHDQDVTGDEIIGSIRVRGLVKYLPCFDYDPTILTNETSYSSGSQFNVIRTPSDYLLIMRIKQLMGFKINNDFNVQKQIPLFNFKNKRGLMQHFIETIKEILSFPDEQRGWIKYAIKEGNKLLKKDKYAAIISSSPPQVSHLVAGKLAMNNSIPWIADLRDLWSQAHYTEYCAIRKYLDKKLELKTLKSSNTLVTVSVPLANKLIALHPGKKVDVITNGYDPDIKNRGWPVSNKFCISYTGRIYRGKEDPELLFKAIKELAANGNININDFEINFYGNYDSWLNEMVTNYELQNYVHINHIIPREEAIKKQRESQILLLLNWNDPQETGIYTGKVFEYLAAGRPILSIGVVSGVVGELLERTKAGIHSGNLNDIKSFLEKLYDEFKTKGYVEYHGNELSIENYNHKEMAKKYSNILNSIT